MPNVPQHLGFVTKSGDFISTGLLDTFATKATNNQTRGLTDAFAKNAYSAQGLVEPRYAPNLLAGFLELNTYHARCCKTKARDTAGLGFVFTPIVDKPSDAQKDELQKFIDQQTTPLGVTLDRACQDFEATGYAVLELVKENLDPKGKPAYINHLPSHTMRLHKEEKKWAQKRGNKIRWFKDVRSDQPVHKDTGIVGNATGEDRASEVMYWINYSSTSEIYGVPDFMPALRAIQGDLSAQEFNIAFFDNYGVPAYAVFVTGDFDPEEHWIDPEDESLGKTSVTQEIQKHFQEMSRKPHSTLVITLPTRTGVNGGSSDGDIKVTFEKLAVEVQDGSFRMYRQDNRDEVLAAHGVPPYRIGIAETGSLGGSTARESTEVYKMSVVEPRQQVIQDLLNRWVVRPLGITDFMLELAEIDTRDEEHEMNLTIMLTQAGAMTKTELREHWADRFGLDLTVELEDEEPIPPELEAAVEGFKRSLEAMKPELPVFKPTRRKAIDVTPEDAQRYLKTVATNGHRV